MPQQKIPSQIPSQQIQVPDQQQQQPLAYLIPMSQQPTQKQMPQQQQEQEHMQQQANSSSYQMPSATQEETPSKSKSMGQQLMVSHIYHVLIYKRGS